MLEGWLQRAQSPVGAWLIFGIVLLPLYVMLLGWFLGKPRDLRLALMGVGYLILIPALLWGSMALLMALVGLVFFQESGEYASAPFSTGPPASTAPFEPSSLGTPETEVSSPSVEAGRQLFSGLGCSGCHGARGEGSSIGPALVGRAGPEVELVSGIKVLAADAYLRESVMSPDAKVAKGNRSGMMPKVKLTDSQLDDLVEFIKSLK